MVSPYAPPGGKTCRAEKEAVMKTRIMIGASLLVLMLLPVTLQEQMAGQQYLFHVDIPFPFT
jgi:hypothetical protein